MLTLLVLTAEPLVRSERAARLVVGTTHLAMVWRRANDFFGAAEGQ